MIDKKKYTQSRPKIPATIQRKVKVEARHSCLVCLQRVSLVMHHVDGNRENNDPTNIVYICSNCHGMVHAGNISAQDLRAYKQKAQEENEIIVKLRQEIRHYTGGENVTVSTDFASLQIKYQQVLAGYAEKLIFYQCFIYLIPEFYIDQRGENVRATVRDMLGVSEEEEQTIIAHLGRLGIIDVVGDGLVVLSNNEDAKIALNELITAKKLNVDALIQKFIGL